MEKKRKYIKKSANGIFFLCIETPEYLIDPGKKTKLWLSSSYLIEESLRDDVNKTIEILNYLIEWNKSIENFEACSRLLHLRNSI
jgi:hypothetical protein